MAKIRGGGFRAMFTRGQVAEYMQDWAQGIDNKILKTLQYTGEQFVKTARLNKTYKDDTGNLRSSIGYIILKDGEVVDESFELSEKGTDRYTGLSKARETANKIASENPNGWVLIGVAGMEYAAAVEAKNYDVITGAGMKAEALLKRLMNQITLTN